MAATHEPERYQEAPVHGHHGFRGIVATETDAHRGHAPTFQRLQDCFRQLAIDRAAQTHRVCAVFKLPIEPGRGDHRHRPGDVNAMRGEHEGRLGARKLEAKSELLHGASRPRRQRQLVRRAGFGDHHPAMRGNRGEDQLTHPLNLAALKAPIRTSASICRG